jgi:hypothetical protein
MKYSIMDARGKVIGTAPSANEAKAKLERGRCVFGNQTIVNETGAEIGEEELDSLCTHETAVEGAAA